MSPLDAFHALTRSALSAPDHNIRVGGNRTCASLRSGPAHPRGRGVHTTRPTGRRAHIAFHRRQRSNQICQALHFIEPRGVPRLASKRGLPLVGSGAIKRAPCPQQRCPETGHHARHSQRQRLATRAGGVPQPAAIDRIVCAHRPVDGLDEDVHPPPAGGNTPRLTFAPNSCPFGHDQLIARGHHGGETTIAPGCGRPGRERTSNSHWQNHLQAERPRRRHPPMRR